MAPSSTSCMPTNPGRRRCARDRHRRQAPAADVRDHHRRLRPPLGSASSTTTTPIKVLEGTMQDDSWFAFIAAVDEGDDWTDPRYGEGQPQLRPHGQGGRPGRKAEKAIALPGAQNAFRRMHLNEWTEQADRWIDLAAWEPAPVRSTWRRCAGGAASAASTSGHHRRHRLRLGVPARADDGLGMCCRASSCPRRTCARAERDRVPYDLWPGRASSRRPPATSSTTAPSSSASSPMRPSSRSRRSPTTPGRHPDRPAPAGRGRDHGRVPPGLPHHGRTHGELEKLIVSASSPMAAIR